jgi:hypothetical protein
MENIRPANVLEEKPMWGLSIPFWQSVVLWANIVALAGGIATGAALFVSAWVSSNIADVVQQDADKRITDARTRGDEARADAAKANQRASEAAERAAVLEKEAAQLRLDLEKERGIREPRTFSPTQQNSVAGKISSFAGTGFVMYVQLAPEPIAFLSQLEAMLKTAKWVPHPPAPPTPTVNFPNLEPVGQSTSFFGIRVWFDGTHNPSLRLAAEALSSALRTEEIATTLDDDAFSDGIDPSFIVIQIGEKPRASLP